MLDAIKNFFDTRLATQDTEDDAVCKIQLASAALMIEVMNADHELDERESAKFLDVLRQQLELDPGEIAELMELAQEEARQATSLFEFTALINENYDYDQKLTLMENMWRIAFSDEKLDKYEDHLIRKISELIYVSHSDFIRTKLKIRNA